MSEANVSDDQGRELPLDDTTASEQTADDAVVDAAVSGVNDDQLAIDLQEANNRALRAQADLENFRKRSLREMEAQQRFASLPLISDLLPLMHNLDRAIEAAEQQEQSSALLEGVRMVSQQLLSVLEQHHCRQIEAAGTPFDPNLHEAIGKEPSLEHPDGTVTRVARIGYQLHDRVVRPSQVLISSGAPAEDGAG